MSMTSRTPAIVHIVTMMDAKRLNDSAYWCEFVPLSVFSISKVLCIGEAGSLGSADSRFCRYPASRSFPQLPGSLTNSGHFFDTQRSTRRDDCFRCRGSHQRLGANLRSPASTPLSRTTSHSSSPSPAQYPAATVLAARHHGPAK